MTLSTWHVVVTVTVTLVWGFIGWYKGVRYGQEISDNAWCKSLTDNKIDSVRGLQILASVKKHKLNNLRGRMYG